MARLTPTTAPHWLLHATTKLEKSIYRNIEFKYRGIITELTDRVQALESEVETLYKAIDKTEDICFEWLTKIQDLETQLRVYERPTVVIKDLREEIKRVKTVTKQPLTLYENINKENEVVNIFRNKPGKNLESGPPPSTIPPKPTAITKSRKRNHSKSPENSSQQQVRSKPPAAQPLISIMTTSSPNLPSECPLTTPPLTTTRKRKRKKTKEKIHDDVS